MKIPPPDLYPKFFPYGLGFILPRTSLGNQGQFFSVGVSQYRKPLIPNRQGIIPCLQSIIPSHRGIIPLR